jgi:hypothetical protein
LRKEPMIRPNRPAITAAVAVDTLRGFFAREDFPARRGRAGSSTN